jgi:TldD protein
VEELARHAADRALTKLRARPAPSGALPVVVGPGGGGVLFHEACGHGLEADLVAKSASVFAGRKGELVASPLVTLIDDATMAGRVGLLRHRR